MGLGKILTYAVVGVGAVAAAPFTGGGSLLAAGVSLGASLAGAGTIAAAAGAGIAGAGIAVATSREGELEEKEEKIKKQEKELAKLSLQQEEVRKNLADYAARTKDTAEYFNCLCGIMAFGVAIARVDDGKIDEYERRELEEFLCGTTAKLLPQHVREKMEEIYNDKSLTFDKAQGFLPAINQESREIIKKALYTIAYSNSSFHENQRKFIENYDTAVAMLENKTK